MSKDHFYFNRNDRVVALVLLIIILTVNIIRIPHKSPAVETMVETDSTIHTSYRRQPKDSTRIYYRRDTVRIKTYVRDTVTRKSIAFRADSAKRVIYTGKTRPLSPLDLNATDSSALVQLPGIGPVFASRIIRYREQLGGFATINQLSEISGLPDSLMEWFIIGDSIPLEKIKVNRETLSEIRRHPYLNFYQARAIIELRRERGDIKGPEQLSLLEEFTARDLERLMPYLDFR